MVNTDLVHELELRQRFLMVKRRMFVEALSIRPKDLRASLGLKGPTVSFVLNGTRRLTRDELDKVVPLVVERLTGLFG